MSPLDKPAGEVTGDVGMGDFGGGSTDGLVSTAGELWWFKMGSNRLVPPKRATLAGIQKPG